MTEDQIERYVERRTDELDRQLTNGDLPQVSYDEECRLLARWADTRYAERKAVADAVSDPTWIGYVRDNSAKGELSLYHDRDGYHVVKPSGEKLCTMNGWLEPRECVQAAEGIIAAARLFQPLADLVEWGARMGGFEGDEWVAAKVALTKVRDARDG